MRKLIRFFLIAGTIVLALFLIMCGLLSIYGMDFHEDPLLSVAYCALPLLAIPALICALRWRKLIVIPALFAVIYLAVYSALNWRTCASAGYCGSMASTVLMTLKTHAALAYLGVAILSIVAISMQRKRLVNPQAGK